MSEIFITNSIVLCYFFLPVFVSDSAAGWGEFVDSGQNLSSLDSVAVALGDVDGDGDLDAFVANFNDQPNKVWENDGTGTFTDSGQNLSSLGSIAVALGDVDGDGDLDAFVANLNQPNKVWLYFYYCFADIDTDRDVDGKDLAAYAEGGTGISLADFSAEYSRTNCQ